LLYFGKRSRFSEEKREKERVTPEFGEGKEEKILPPNSGRYINRPNFSLSPADLDNIPNLARSIANRFIKLVWTKGGRSKAGDEARSHLKPVTKLYLVPTSSFKLKFCLPYFDTYMMTKPRSKLRSKETKPKA
jgi:hypothetical protein